jgi:hypothetical protein
MDQEKRRIHILKQRIGLDFFPSTLVRDAGVVHEGNRENWAALKRAEETYVGENPLLKTDHNGKPSRSMQTEELLRQALGAMRELTTSLLGDPDRASEAVAELTRRVHEFKDEPPPRSIRR